MTRLVSVLVLAGVVCACGCAPRVACNGLTIEPPREDPASPVMLPAGSGRLSAATATPVGGHLYLTAAHVVDPAVVPGRGSGCGEGAGARLVARGFVGDGAEEDWALIELDGSASASWRIRVDGGVRVGDEVVVIGYRSSLSEGGFGFQRTVRRGRVSRLPWWAIAPRCEHVAYLCLDGPTHGGMSGGPVLRRAADGAWELIGIHTGSYDWRGRFLWGSAQLLSTPSLRAALEAEGVVSGNRP